MSAKEKKIILIGGIGRPGEFGGELTKNKLIAGGLEELGYKVIGADTAGASRHPWRLLRIPAALLRGECAAFTQRGAKLAGLDVYISSNVPKGSGVSSSAAFEVLIGVILNDCFMTEKVSPIAIAQIGQWAENVYFGKPCGLMDQMASSVGNIITIDFASPAKPVVEPVAVDFSKAGLALCILDSGADHADLTDEYAAIPAECRAVAAVCGGEVLRDVPFETFLAKLPECRRQCGDRAVLRAFHVYADNDRVAKQVAALHDGDFGTFLSLVNESGCSSWEYLQNVIPAGYKEHQEVGVTIAAAKHLLGDKGAVRVHGGGFAGTVQAFVPVEMLDEFKAGMEAILGEGRCHVLSIRQAGGVAVLAHPHQLKLEGPELEALLQKRPPREKTRDKAREKERQKRKKQRETRHKGGRTI